MSLLDAFTNDAEVLKVIKGSGGDFSLQLPAMVSKIFTSYKSGNTDLNAQIAEIAKERDLNDEQIKRVLEGINNKVYVHEYEQKMDSYERSVDFELADFRKIKSLLDSPIDAIEVVARMDPKGESMEKIASEGGMLFEERSSYLRPTTRIHAPNNNLDVHHLEVVANALNTLEEKIASDMKDVDALDEVANAVIDYSIRNEDPSDLIVDLFDAAEKPIDKVMLKDAIRNRLQEAKETNRVPDDVFIDIDKILEDADEKSKFTLGEASQLVKSASEKIAYVDYKPYTTSKLVGMVKAASAKSAEVKKNINKLEMVKTASKLSEENLEAIDSFRSNKNVMATFLKQASLKEYKSDFNVAKSILDIEKIMKR